MHHSSNSYQPVVCLIYVFKGVFIDTLVGSADHFKLLSKLFDPPGKIQSLTPLIDIKFFDLPLPYPCFVKMNFVDKQVRTQKYIA